MLDCCVAVIVTLLLSSLPMSKTMSKLNICNRKAIDTFVRFAKRYLKLKTLFKPTSQDSRGSVLTTELTSDFLQALDVVVDSKILKDSTDGAWHCTDCAYSSQYRTNTRGHVETHHVASQGFNCPICSKFCVSKNALRIHRKRYNHN